MVGPLIGLAGAVGRQLAHDRRGIDAGRGVRVEHLDVLVVVHGRRAGGHDARAAAGLVPAADDQHLAVGELGERGVPAPVGHVRVAGPGLGPRVEGHHPLAALEAVAHAVAVVDRVLEVAADHQHAPVGQQCLARAPQVGRHLAVVGEGDRAAVVGDLGGRDGLRCVRERIPHVGVAAVRGLVLGRVLGLGEEEDLVGRHHDRMDRGRRNVLQRPPCAVGCRGRLGRDVHGRESSGRYLGVARPLLGAEGGVRGAPGWVGAQLHPGDGPRLGLGGSGLVRAVVVEAAALDLVQERLGLLGRALAPEGHRADRDEGREQGGAPAQGEDPPTSSVVGGDNGPPRPRDSRVLSASPLVIRDRGSQWGGAVRPADARDPLRGSRGPFRPRRRRPVCRVAAQRRARRARPALIHRRRPVLPGRLP